MEYFLLILGLVGVVVGFLGSFLPVLPGAPVSWLGLLCLFFVPGVEMSSLYLISTLLIVVCVVVLGYVIPAQGTKKFGGTKYGVWGTNIGLLVGIFLPVPGGFIIGPFVGALLGELIYDSKDVNRALKAAVGSFMGFLASTFLSVVVCTGILILFCWIVYSNIHVWY